jgi:hypothetical protein
MSYIFQPLVSSMSLTNNPPTTYRFYANLNISEWAKDKYNSSDLQVDKE